MTASAELLLSAADVALGVLEDEATLAAWQAPSALPEFTVGGLAAHLATQVIALPGWLSDEPQRDLPTITIDEHYSRAAWVDSGLRSESNTAIRDLGEQVAREVHAATLLADTRSALATLREVLPTLPVDRPAANPRWQWSLPLGDFLLTRMVELVVHTDDLAVSVDRRTPDFDDEVIGLVTGVLLRAALRRHGQQAVVRALSRTERAPASIAAI